MRSRCFPLLGGSTTELSVTDSCRWHGGDATNLPPRFSNYRSILLTLGNLTEPPVMPGNEKQRRVSARPLIMVRTVAAIDSLRHPLVPLELVAVNKFAIYLAPKRIDYRYLEVLIVTEALVAEVLGNFPAMPNRFGICVEFDSHGISMRDAILHIKEELLHCCCL
jgi:hypothetical protein